MEFYTKFVGLFQLILIIIIGIIVINGYFSKNQQKLWNPLVFIGLYFVYYVIVPCFSRNELNSNWGTIPDKSIALMLSAALVNYVCIISGFFIIRRQWNGLHRLTSRLELKYLKKYAISLFLIALIIEIITNGLSFAVSSSFENIEYVFDENASYGHSGAYITHLVCLFIPACALAMTLKKHRWRYFIFFLFVTANYYILGAFRYRLVILFGVLVLFWNLYPKPHKVNLKVWVPLLVGLVLLTNIIGMTRRYGSGIDYSKIQQLDSEEITASPGESLSVFAHSTRVMQLYEDTQDFIYFEPLITAIAMPFPRVMFPEKPKGLYLRDVCVKLYGTADGGNAFLNFVEAYIAFGWIGIIINGFFMGMLSKLVWLNYINHTKSIGNILFLGLYNGWCYIAISRGYMASALMFFMYYVLIPFWVISLINFYQRNFTKN